jgi:hypothetical protein
VRIFGEARVNPLTVYSICSRLGDIPDQSVSADSFQGSGTGSNGTFQSFLSELIPVDSRYFIKNFY